MKFKFSTFKFNYILKTKNNELQKISSFKRKIKRGKMKYFLKNKSIILGWNK